LVTDFNHCISQTLLTRIPQINGRVMVDCKTFCLARPSHAPSVRAGRPGEETFHVVDGVAPEMTLDEYMICHHMVAGFALKEKRWAFFEIDLLSEIDYDDETFQSSLILDEEYKT